MKIQEKRYCFSIIKLLLKKDFVSANDITFEGIEKECYASVIKVQITASKKWINLLLIYGLGETQILYRFIK